MDKEISKIPLCAIDFEFNRPAEKHMGLICVALKPEDQKDTVKYWLRDPKDKISFIRHMAQLKASHVFVGYSIQQAEARCIAALGMDPCQFTWRDLMLEWRWLRNGDNRFSYGRIIHNGFPRITVPPKARVSKKASQEEIDEAESINREYLEGIREGLDEDVDITIQEAGWSMLDCTYFFGKIGYSDYNRAMKVKAEIRDEIIIKGDDATIEANRAKILEYCAADVGDLNALAHKITEEMENVCTSTHVSVEHGQLQYCDMDEGVDAIQVRIGDWAARLAKYGNRGIPLNKKRLDRLVELVPVLQEETKAEWVRMHPEAPIYRMGQSEGMLGLKKQGLKQSPFVKPKYTKDDSLLEAAIEYHCKQCGIDSWPRTRTKKVDTSAKIIEKYAAGENLIKHYQRHQGQLSALRTYAPNAKGHIEAFDYIGTDYIQRPDFGPFGTQTARNAAKAKSYCFLGPHWIRMLVEPPKGKVVCECDYSAQEVFIAGAITGDQNMIDAYMSNDVYMYYAQLTGMYPKDLPIPTEEQRSEEWYQEYRKTRNISKTLCLLEGTKVITKDGIKNIEDVTEMDYIWDSVSWIRSKGAVYNGIKAVTEVDGIWATPDHLFETTVGWEETRNITSNTPFKRPPHPPGSWRRVWKLVCTLLRTFTKRA